MLNFGVMVADLLLVVFNLDNCGENVKSGGLGNGC